MKRPTKYQRALLRGKGLPVPESRAEARVMTRLVMDVDSPKPDHADALTLVVREQREQIRELHRLVRYQKLHIARIQAGEDVPE